MSRISKAIFFGLLFLTAISQLIFGTWQLGAFLIILLVVGLIVFEKREAKRSFYKALRKLFVCADHEAFLFEMNQMNKNAFIKKSTHDPYQLLKLIDSYYSDERFLLADRLKSHAFKRDYEFWRLNYLGMLTRDEKLFDSLVTHQTQVPRYFSAFAYERISLLSALISEDLDAVNKCRAELTANLFIAELTYQLAVMSEDPKRIAYYKKSALNISKGLIK